MATDRFGAARSAPDARSRARYRLVDGAARAWKWLHTLYQVFLLVRFSVLLGIVGGLVLVLNGQAQDVVRALGEDPDRRVLWLIGAALASAGVAWWSARIMFYFRFRNPASAPTVFPTLKEHLPRVLGAWALALVAIALVRASFSYDGWFVGPAGRLGGLALVFLLLAAGFVYVTAKRRVWLARWTGGQRPADLESLKQLHWQAWLPLVIAGAVGFALMILFAYQAVEVAPELGTAAVGLLAALGLIPVGSLLVYWGNRAELPAVTLALLWLAFASYWADNNYVRLDAAMPSYQAPEPAPAPPDAGPDAASYFAGWVAGLEPGADGRIPVFIVAAEGGGIRAAYWTALVLGELQDQAALSGVDFARHLFAISGVSGGSLGAAAFAALVANRRAGLEPKAGDGCPADATIDVATLRGRAERILQRDFLSPTVAVMLFPDLFQQFVPFGFLNDRATAIERSFERAWADCEEGDWFARSFEALWSAQDALAPPLLFLNSTVVDTGQRLIAAPVAIAEPTFAEALDNRLVLGPEVPLSTAVHDSARFTYVSPAGTVRRRDAPTQWLRLVDGGYFENSGAVTATEILRLVQNAAAGRPEVRPVVIHISNDPEITDPGDLAEQRKVLNQVVAPLKALLHVRPARGFQAREHLADIAGQGSHVHFRLCRKPGQEAQTAAKKAPLPLGWALSQLAREEMRSQLGVAGDGAGDAIRARNQANLKAVLALLEGEPFQGDPSDPWSCPEAVAEAAAP
jgi:hypothetical protein